MTWTFGRKLAVGFGLPILMLVVIGVLAYRTIDVLVDNNARVTHSHEVVDHIARLIANAKDAETGQRGYVITGIDDFLEPYNAALPSTTNNVRELRHLVRDNPAQLARVDQAENLINLKYTEMKRVLDARRGPGGFEAAQKMVQNGDGKRYMDDLRKVAAAMEQDERELLRERGEAAEANARASKIAVGIVAVLALLLVFAASSVITRSLGRQLTAEVKSIRSSSAELQAAAAQQASGSREQLAATTEVATTIRELLATSRQITESAQRVARNAEETASGAHSGMNTVRGAHEVIQQIKKQMDVVVTHMLALGKKSQEAGGILDLVNELAEQTNILAINATIEAAGAGESGRRFSVVADEIRKLADRVGGSTKEIRSLVDDMRAAVNTTVMATESTVKAVDAGTLSFGEVTTSFTRIASLVTTTTEAAREIELSTKQQSTAVEQVSSAIGSVAQATRESDSSAKQTLESAGALTELSRRLLRLVDAAEA